MAWASSSITTGVKEKSLGMNADELAAARRIGGLTFSPRRRNKLVCNQARRLGLISPRQADCLRSQVFPKKGRAKAVRVRISRTRASHLNNWQSSGYVHCPECGQRHSDVNAGMKDCACGALLQLTD
jgi:hypothetical protein